MSGQIEPTLRERVLYHVNKLHEADVATPPAHGQLTGFTPINAASSPSASSNMEAQSRPIPLTGVQLPSFKKRRPNPPDAEASSTADAGSIENDRLETVASQAPAWYKTTAARLDRTVNRELLNQLTNLLNSIAKYRATRDMDMLDQIRNGLSNVEFLDVDAVHLKIARLLDPDGGLSVLFEDEWCPFDIRADSRALYKRWSIQNFEGFILRGIDYGSTGRNRNSSKMQKGYLFQCPANCFGANDLENGQWWPLLIAAKRDGAHNSIERGICFAKNEGAYSVLVSGSHYQDVDSGNEILYTGVDAQSGDKIKDDTAALHTSLRTGTPVRVLRSSKLPVNNIYRPAVGFRYDGLVSPTIYHKFLVLSTLLKFAIV